jgi:predicted nucleic acid-binding Zn ribbon protein
MKSVITAFVHKYYMAESTTPSGYNYTCDECGASFEAMEDLTKHYRQDHPQSQ